MHCTAYVAGDPAGCARCGERRDLHEGTCHHCGRQVGMLPSGRVLPWVRENGQVRCAERPACKRAALGSASTEGFRAADVVPLTPRPRG